MSTNYFIYTEAKIGDKWIGIDPLIPKMDYDHKNYKYKNSFKFAHSETYWNGSRSYFHETFDKLRDLGSSVKFANLSEEVKQEWQRTVESEQKGEQIYTEAIQIDFNFFKQSFDCNAYSNHGLVHKNAWFQFMSGEIEDLYTEEHDDFKRLTKEERQCYEYHEWDNSYDWNRYLKIIYQKVLQRINDFANMNNLCVNSAEDHFQYRIIVIRD